MFCKTPLEWIDAIWPDSQIQAWDPASSESLAGPDNEAGVQESGTQRKGTETLDP